MSCFDKRQPRSFTSVVVVGLVIEAEDGLLPSLVKTLIYLVHLRAFPSALLWTDSRKVV